MKIQILYIHGGDAFSNYDDFLECLRTESIDDPFNTEVRKKWKEKLKIEFGEHADILLPSMPNKQNAHYIEWKIWFERHFEFLTGEVILIGHSQGGYFLAKYLTENSVPFPVKTLFLVSAPFEPRAGEKEDGGDFNFDTKKLSNLNSVSQNIFIFHSEDDTVVPYSHGISYRNTLPTAKFISFTDRGHFIGPEFPEIIEEIRKIL
jgi:predicted alpha/beta hydrolase family esterase